MIIRQQSTKKAPMKNVRPISAFGVVNFIMHEAVTGLKANIEEPDTTASKATSATNAHREAMYSIDRL